jgi:hypothetical protein
MMANPVSRMLNFFRIKAGSKMLVNNAVVAMQITAIDELANLTDP